MCFSPQADLIAGVALGVVAVDACRHVARPSERALAAIPVVLAAHQLVEVFVWRGLDGEVGDAVWRPAMYAYLAIAFVVVPVLIPVAVEGLEPPAERARVRLFVVLGIMVAAVLAHGLVTGPVTARIIGSHISYDAQAVSHGGLLVVVYLVATCGCVLVSHHRSIQWFGLANLVVAVTLAILYQSALISLWCGWAALTSGCIAWHLRREHPVGPVGGREPLELTAPPSVGG